MLGSLLEKSDVPYAIFERTASVKPLGSAMAVGPNLLPVFQQLGIYDEFLTISKPMDEIASFKENMKPYRPADHRSCEKLAGYGYRIVSRPMMYELFLKQVPADKIFFGKRILAISEKEDKVTVQAADNSTYEGEIIVGADGAYSAVRQRMYEALKAEDKLPKSDQEDLPFTCTCLVGQTKVLDLEEFPELKEPFCRFQSVLGDGKPFTWVTFTSAQNTICWMVVHHLNKTTTKAALDYRFRTSENSEWGSHAVQTMCDETRSLPTPVKDSKGINVTLGDLYDRTPKDLISKVMLEEKVFDTWYSGRTVLMGDACHKIHPSGGQGGVTAMHDAIALANLLYALPSSTSEEITKIFEEYKTERHPAVVRAFKDGQLSSKMTDKGIVGTITLYIFTHIPAWLMNQILIHTLKFRPQLGFLPYIENKGVVAPVFSPSFGKAKAVYEKRRQAVAATAASV
ncbi:hypothetical protein BGX33_011879 [Mortierella sp. NVP41]|nr:hypothetical protein BGX33_011879 [Mortierella sp. NVP41]